MIALVRRTSLVSASLRTPRSAVDDISCCQANSAKRVVYNGTAIYKRTEVTVQIVVKDPASATTIVVDDCDLDDGSEENLNGVLVVEGKEVTETRMFGVNDYYVIAMICQKAEELGYLFLNDYPLDIFGDDFFP